MRLLDCFFSISKGTSVLTKLGYLIDNPWNNALDRAKAAGSVLADVLIQRHLGVRPHDSYWLFPRRSRHILRPC